MKYIFLSVLVVIFTASARGASSADINITGGLRNDSDISSLSNICNFADIEENKIVLTENMPDYRFYSDARIYLFYGVNPPVPSNISTGTTNGAISLLRAFIRYSAGDSGNITAGKTYVNFGEPGVFNPFETVKNVSLDDLNNEKDGELAFMDEFQLGSSSLAGGKIYVSPQAGLSNSAAGASVYDNISGFDAGAVYNRKTPGWNVTGFYFKGDPCGDNGIGVNGSGAFHFNDFGTSNFSEVTMGGDYSFFEDALIAELDFYYDSEGAENPAGYDYLSPDDKYFIAKYYI